VPEILQTLYPQGRLLIKLLTCSNNQKLKKHTFILSTQDINSYGFIVLTSGIVLEFFKKNPVMLLNHKEDKIMGKWDNARIEGTQLLADAIFDETDDEAMKMYSKVEQGMLNCVSIGFEILEVQFGIAGFEDTPVVIKCSLKEASLTPIPSNESALKLYDKEGTVLTSEKVLTLLSKTNTPDNMKKIEFFAAALMSANITLAKDATEDDVLKAVQKLTAENTALQNEKATLETEKTNLTTKLTALQTAAKADEDAKINGLVDGAVKEGKLTADKADQFKTLAKADFETTKNIIDGMVKRTSLSAVIEGAAIASADKYADWGLKRLSKEAPKELARIKAEDPERFKKLVSAND
jgi:HK97 family phage prohead protease